MKIKLIAGLIVIALLAGCAGIQMGDGTGQFGLEIAAFNAGYLVAEKYPTRVPEIKAEIALLEQALTGESNAEAMNLAFQAAVAKLLKVTDNDPLVQANVLFISKKIRFMEVPGGPPIIDLPQMKIILQGFRDGVEARLLLVTL